MNHEPQWRTSRSFVSDFSRPRSGAEGISRGGGEGGGEEGSTRSSCGGFGHDINGNGSSNGIDGHLNGVRMEYILLFFKFLLFSVCTRRLGGRAGFHSARMSNE